jgi:hypothetical protein
MLTTDVHKSALEGLWVLLVNDEINFPETRIPMMARTGNEETYVLGFKNMHKARTFMSRSDVAGAEPRMVVKANSTEYLRIARQAGVSGVLVDYDPDTNEYASASELY